LLFTPVKLSKEVLQKRSDMLGYKTLWLSEWGIQNRIRRTGVHIMH